MTFSMVLSDVDIRRYIKDGKIKIVGEIEVQNRSGPCGHNLDSVTMEPRTVVVTMDGRIE